MQRAGRWGERTAPAAEQACTWQSPSPAAAVAVRRTMPLPDEEKSSLSQMRKIMHISHL